jgi:hypothetical protein
MVLEEEKGMEGVKFASFVKNSEPLEKEKEIMMAPKKRAELPSPKMASKAVLLPT